MSLRWKAQVAVHALRRLLRALFRMNTAEEVRLWRDAFTKASNDIAFIRYGWNNSPHKGPMAEREYFVLTMKKLQAIREEMDRQQNRITGLTGRR